MKTHKFPTRTDAIAAGYRTPVKGRDKDISGQNSFGYSFEDSDGKSTVTVSLTEELNRLGRKGCYDPMFPPTQPTE